jgi:hypothetical protein
MESSEILLNIEKKASKFEETNDIKQMSKETFDNLIKPIKELHKVPYSEITFEKFKIYNNAVRSRYGRTYSLSRIFIVFCALLALGQIPTANASIGVLMLMYGWMAGSMYFIKPNNITKPSTSSDVLENKSALNSAPQLIVDPIAASSSSSVPLDHPNVSKIEQAIPSPAASPPLPSSPPNQAQSAAIITDPIVHQQLSINEINKLVNNAIAARNGANRIMQGKNKKQKRALYKNIAHTLLSNGNMSYETKKAMDTILIEKLVEIQNNAATRKNNSKKQEATLNVKQQNTRKNNVAHAASSAAVSKPSTALAVPYGSRKQPLSRINVPAYATQSAISSNPFLPNSEVLQEQENVPEQAVVYNNLPSTALAVPYGSRKQPLSRINVPFHATQSAIVSNPLLSNEENVFYNAPEYDPSKSEERTVRVISSSVEQLHQAANNVVHAHNDHQPMKEPIVQLVSAIENGQSLLKQLPPLKRSSQPKQSMVDTWGNILGKALSHASSIAQSLVTENALPLSSSMALASLPTSSSTALASLPTSSSMALASLPTSSSMALAPTSMFSGQTSYAVSRPLNTITIKNKTRNILNYEAIMRNLKNKKLFLDSLKPKKTPIPQFRSIIPDKLALSKNSPSSSQPIDSSSSSQPINPEELPTNDDSLFDYYMYLLTAGIAGAVGTTAAIKYRKTHKKSTNSKNNVKSYIYQYART